MRKRHIRSSETGFTLLELLIVIGILAILAGVVVFVLNPVEILRKSRDTQRISDLAAVKTALGVYTTSTTTPHMDNSAYASRNEKCLNGTGTKTLYYSYPSDSPGQTISYTTFSKDSAGTVSFTAAGQVTNAVLGSVSGTGWLPVNLIALTTTGPPISNWPTDPTNTITGTVPNTTATSTYRYACDKNDFTFEVNATLESTAFTTNPDNKHISDGGNNSNVYEVGSKLTIIGPGTDF